ncbi:hypothetical protein PS718_03943 [Pseudomonas fluorescens]|uniref:DUF4347 domain-containing protein n=1 Tax=Pseudomonas fluorescens TaxID=294 RepID=A0A5E7DVZ6_PSEFL|nr:hypothetical protein [Pseudomonas fluorescens]VVO17578.1 hypothetical protein PS718_03943 [Pseudomonas fluorescens]
MHIWHGVVTVIAKKNKGVVVKNRSGSEELLVPFDLCALVEIDFDERVYHSDKDNTPWVEPEERQYVQVGTEVELFSETDTFPTNKDQVISVSFRFNLGIVKGGKSGYVTRGTAVIIYHDFHQDVAKGDSGTAFAEAVTAYYQTLGKPSIAIKTESTYAHLISELQKVADKNSEQFFVDTILIATHGSAGQLWLGHAHSYDTQNVMSQAKPGKNFTLPQTFGATLFSMFGKGLAIAIYACDFLGDEDGHLCALQLRTASQAKAVYAGTGTVYLNADKTGRSTVVCKQVKVVYRADTIETFGGSQIPVFEI